VLKTWRKWPAAGSGIAMVPDPFQNSDSRWRADCNSRLPASKRTVLEPKEETIVVCSVPLLINVVPA